MKDVFSVSTFGRSDYFSINCYIHDIADSKSASVFGCFFLYINGIRYGKCAPEVTYLDLSYDGIVERLQWRGRNRCTVLEDADLQTVLSMHRTCMWPAADGGEWRGMPMERVARQVVNSGVILAPDGDAAFGDGSQVYQVDLDDGQVDLFAFKHRDDPAAEFADQTSLRLSSNGFYDALEEFALWFERTTGFVRPPPPEGQRRIRWAES